MKAAASALVLMWAFGIPALAFAKVDGNSGLTRAEVHEDLERVENAGYRPGQSEDLNYPQDIQSAEKKIWAEDSKSGMTPSAATASAEK